MQGYRSVEGDEAVKLSEEYCDDVRISGNGVNSDASSQVAHRLSHLMEWPWIVLALGLICVILFVYCVVKRRKRTALQIADWKKNVVYMFNFEPSNLVPSISPFGMKLETWLRLHKIKHECSRVIGVYANETKQIPFIELNGVQIADSTICIEYLADHFGIDAEEEVLSPEEVAYCRAINVMIDQQLTMSHFYHRYVTEASAFIYTWVFIPAIFRRILGWNFPRKFKERSRQHGIGRHPVKQIIEFGNGDLRALSVMLGDKPFLFGDKMVGVDCSLFGVMSNILYAIPESVENPHKDFVLEECENLVAFTKVVKETLWEDWDDIVQD